MYFQMVGAAEKQEKNAFFLKKQSFFICIPDFRIYYLLQYNEEFFC